MKITGCRFVRVTGRLTKNLGDDHGRALQPADVDPAFATRPYRRPSHCAPDPDGVRRIPAIFVQLETDAGVTGTACQISRDQVAAIRERLLPWLIGRDPLAIEANWDFMFRLLGGRNLAPASTLDCALWDIKGKVEGAPVYQLLGGPKQPDIIPYAGMVGHPMERDAVRQRAAEAKAAGFVAQKWYPPCSTGHGPDGMQRNLDLARTLRETVGDEVELMFDAHQGWPVEYAVAMARALQPYRPRWLEEPVMSDDFEGYRAVRAAAGFPIAGSEAHQNRWQAEAMLRAGVVDVYQPEPAQACITEMMRIAKLVADHGKQMAMHCGYFETLHVVAALPRAVCPYYEYLWNWNEYGQWFYRNKCAPVNGVMPLPPGPGLGLELDDDRIESREEI
jgi:L-rhamnonate dehydratase